MKQQQHKPIIETMINTAALAMTAAGTNFAIMGDYKGYLLVVFGAALEFFKYWGRTKKFW